MGQADGEATAPDDPILGRAIGNYMVDKRLGMGGMGAVYRLKHKDLPNTYQAVKVLSGEGELDQVARERFRQEALVAAAVGSHRVVRPIDLGQFDDHKPYILMEYVDGRSLEAELRERGPLPIATALRIAARVADTMVIAHHASIIHRDLKPANLMLVREGDGDFAVKLLDFGIARASGELKLTRTAQNMIMGTPGYWSPEAVAGKTMDGRADVFSLGVILFEMLAGDLPFAAGTVEAAMVSVLDQTPAPPPSNLRPADLGPIPEEVEALVARALAKQRVDRPDMVDFHRALTAAIERLAPAPAPSHRPQSVVLPARPGWNEAPTLSPAKEAPQLIDASPPAVSGAAPPRDNANANDLALPTPKTNLFARPPKEIERREEAVTIAAPAVAARPQRPGRKAMWWIGAGAVAVAALVSLWTVTHRTVRGVPPEKPTVAAPTKPPPVPSLVRPTVTPLPPPAPVAKRVHLRVDSDPAGATIVRVSDQRVLGVTPQEIEMDAARGEARFALHLDGYRPATVRLPADRDGGARPRLATVRPTPVKRKSLGDKTLNPFE
jgi:eukaryotic-like serine/threonine-protein kinase